MEKMKYGMKKQFKVILNPIRNKFVKSNSLLISIELKIEVKKSNCVKIYMPEYE